MRRWVGAPRNVSWLLRWVDGLLLLSLLAIGLGWWLFEVSWAFGTWSFSYKWNKAQILWPLLFVVLHGLLAWGLKFQSDPAVGPAGLLHRKGIQRFILAYCTCFVSIIVVEHVLNRMNYDVHIAPIVLKSKSQGMERYHRELIRDPHLLWKFEPGSTVYGRKINRLGFREREINPVKEKGVHRVICLGDSVTAQGIPGYSQYLHEMLVNDPPCGEKWEAFNMGVYGYSSMQGLMLLRLYVTNLQPDVVTVSFGRNDHVLAAVTDRVRMPVDSSPFMKGLYEVLHGRLLGRVFLHALDRGNGWSSVKNKSGVRVPPEEFRDNLRAFVGEIRAMGAAPVLITAPRRTITHQYVTAGYARSEEEFQRQHDDYAQIVREVAQETGAALLDLQQLMAGKECDEWFAPDAVHFDFYDNEVRMTCGGRNQPGLQRIAQEMYKELGTLCSRHQLVQAKESGGVN